MRVILKNFLYFEAETFLIYSVFPDGSDPQGSSRNKTTQRKKEKKKEKSSLSANIV